MQFINWGHESPEQKAARDKWEAELYEAMLVQNAINQSAMQMGGAAAKYEFPAWNKTPYTADDCKQFVQALRTNLITGTNSSPLTTTISTLTPSLGTAGWNGGVVAPTGMIYFAPGSATNIAKLDPTTDTFSLVGPTFSTATGKYLGGVLAPNGYIYFMPGRNGNILKLNPADDSVTQITAAYGNALANSCILSPQGNIYTIPQTNSVIVKLDTSTDTLSTITRPSVNVSGNLWCGAALAEDGKIYMMPTSCNAVVELDPATDIMKTYEVFNTSLRNQYLGAVLGPNGLIYAIPNESFQVMTFDPIRKTAAFKASGGYAYGGTMGPDGVVYMNSAYYLPTVNTLDNSTPSYTVAGRPAPGTFWYGGGAIMALNGNVYISGNNTAGTFTKITYSGTNTLDPNWVLARQVNKF